MSEKSSWKNQIVEESFQTRCIDGVVLKGKLLIPESPKAIVQFNCGTATKKEVYHKFLKYIAEHNFICCLWDYRDSGESAPSSLKDCAYVYSDYGTKDMPAIKDFLTSKFPDLPFLILGHSTGGQQVGFMNNLEGIKGAINFAVSTGYYPNMPLSYRMNAYVFFYIFAPLSVLFTGYVAAKRFGFMEDLPKGVAYQWRAWCSKKDYLFDKRFYGKSVPLGNYQNFHFPIHVYWTVDDTISNEANTKNLWGHIKSAKGITFTKVVPKEYGVPSIGHFGFFRRKLKSKLWKDVVFRLEQMLED